VLLWIIHHQMMVLVGDCSDREEGAADGLISFSINGHKELCAIHKPGGVSVSVPVILQASALASSRASMLHQLLAESLRTLEERVKADRLARLEVLRKVHQLGLRSIVKKEESLPSANEKNKSTSVGGVDRDDPMLAWGTLHSSHIKSSN